MSLPSQDVLDEIKLLITEITGFQEGDENFEICQRYCLSHVVHHTYPFVNRTSVKTLIDSYESRFYGHGYFKVSQELRTQVDKFLQNQSLFEKNPQYDIQWCLLSLISSLSTNLTSVKKVPELLPTEDEECKKEEINWGEYLKEDLPKVLHSIDLDSESDSSLTENEESVICKNRTVPAEEKTLCQIEEKSGVPIKVRNELDGEELSLKRRSVVYDLMKSRLSIADIENDYRTRGNISEKFDSLLCREGLNRNTQYLSELELMEYILYQFQTGEKIFLKKGLNHPALMSVTQNTLGSYLEALQPYFRIIRSFIDFNEDVVEAKYPGMKRGKCCQSSSDPVLPVQPTSGQKVPNVLFMYNSLLKKALEPFQGEIMEIVNDLGSYSLIQMHHKLQSHFFDLTSLFYVHGLATKNWRKSSNWSCSVRVLAALYNAITTATTSKMSFLYLNMFLQCFQVYLDVIDSWISVLKLNDPNDEFILTRSTTGKISDCAVAEFEVRPYKREIQTVNVKEVPILDFIAEKMVQVGQSLEVLRRLDRFVADDAEPNEPTSYERLVKAVNSKIDVIGRLAAAAAQAPPPKVEEKKRSIFTLSHVGLTRSWDGGGGDTCELMGRLLDAGDGLEEKSTAAETAAEATADDGGVVARCDSNHCGEFVASTVRNLFFLEAFNEISVRQKLKRFEETQEGSARESSSLYVVRKPSNAKSAVYPYHKIITESCQEILGNRILKVCALVKDIVTVECHLKSHLSLFRSLFLFGDSHLIQPFMILFFTQPAIWQSSYSLTLHLKECLETRYKDFVSGLSVSLAKDGVVGRKNVLEAIDTLTIDYHFDWPLTLVFTQSVMLKYNRVFRLAMKLKWAHWILTNLHARGGKVPDESKLLTSTRHRLRILRFWFLSTLNRVNNYFMAQMSPADLDLNSCDNLKDIINAHCQFIDAIYYHCLLTDKAPEMWTILFDTLMPLCVDLDDCWTDGRIVPNAKLTSMETIFGNCQQQLSRLMSSLESK